MPLLWLNFALLFFVMLLEFLGYAYYQKKLAEVPRALFLGAVSVFVFCLPCELINTKYLGLGSYALGFGPFLLLWGLFAANILLMREKGLAHFLLWLTVINFVNEILNLQFHLWTFAFVVPSIEYVIVEFVFPLALAVIIAFAWQVLFGYRFVFIDNVIKRYF